MNSSWETFEVYARNMGGKASEVSGGNKEYVFADEEA